MREDYERTKILITVFTYPHPSKGFKELVCTGGITESGEWIRLYPIDYRYLQPQQKFKKYQWIEVDLLPTGSGNDNRKESRKPKLETIEVIGEPLSTRNNWQERRRYIDHMPHNTITELIELYDNERISLGIVRPSRVLDIDISRVDEEWKPEWQALFNQMRVLGDSMKPLRKLPYKFQYVFECNDSKKPHCAMIEDWELGVLFLKESDRLGSDEKAASSVKSKYLDEICRSDKDTRFFMGTRFPYNTWLVVGVFWPPKIDTVQEELFK